MDNRAVDIVSSDSDSAGDEVAALGLPTAAASPSALAPSAVTLAAYTIGREIGRGQFSIVKRAIRSDGTVYALKRVAFDALSPHARAKCLSELLLIQSLRHPNIVTCTDSFREGGDLILVLEYAGACSTTFVDTNRDMCSMLRIVIVV